MSDQHEYLEQLGSALSERHDWIERSDMPKLKEDFRAFLTALTTLYGIFVKRGYIADDPYRNDAKTDDLKVPDLGALVESNKRDQIGRRMSELDKELDHLVNFYQFSIENFTQGKIKIMMGLVTYINWTRLSPDSESPITQAVNNILNEARHTDIDPVTRTTLNQAVMKLSNYTSSIANHLKLVSEFNREQYKYDLRLNITASMTQDDAKVPEIKKRFASRFPKQPFYAELAEELVREDYSAKGPELRESVLKKLVVEKAKPKTAKPPRDVKRILIDALNALGSAYTILAELLQKLALNHDLVNNKKLSFWGSIVKMLQQMGNKEPEPFIYELGFAGAGAGKGGANKEQLNYAVFTAELERLSRVLQSIAVNGAAQSKLEAMSEEQLADVFQRNMKDALIAHKTLSALDEYFKANVDKADRTKVKGIKPELGALKSVTLKANDKLIEYNSIKEEEAQFKKLGIDAAT
ncbi:MAG: hypothetical protein LBS82_02220 [Spirochaetaceae bacterium]|jgi:hypothetical protein|nr:hypothetical protein [Spirochaetaceae bacterium]